MMFRLGRTAEPTRLVSSIALPAMLTYVATALFGLADMWVIGRLGDAAVQSAVELGAKFMMALLIVFALSFLIGQRVSSREVAPLVIVGGYATSIGSAISRKAG
ncbi:hypothetical protein [Novosphingobium sp. G106]|uniref:hypothetical protein n=1 Tax=Novosphingobium sp. G106 TaxID=2849500 RepID=UPI0020C46B3B|nr:hypothetical protein [Novosphingobium sp. G106]